MEEGSYTNRTILRLLFCFIRRFRDFRGFRGRGFLLCRLLHFLRVFVDQRVEELIGLARPSLVAALERQC